MMSSCCTLRLKRRKAFSKDSDSWMMTSATLNSPPIRFGLVTCGVVVYGAPPMDIIACNQRHVHEHVDRMYGASCSQFRYQVSSDSCEKRVGEKGKRRAIGARYTDSVVVTDSKVLDLVGIPSILGDVGSRGTGARLGCSIGDRIATSFPAPFTAGEDGSPIGAPCIQTCAASRELCAGGRSGDQGIVLRL